MSYAYVNFLLSVKYIKTKSLLAIGHKRDTNPILRKESRATNQAAVFHWECEQTDTSKHLRHLYDLVVRTYSIEQYTPGSITVRINVVQQTLPGSPACFNASTYLQKKQNMQNDI